MPICQRCSAKWRPVRDYTHPQRVWDVIDRLMNKRAYVNRIGYVLRQVRDGIWIDDICSRCWIELTKIYVGRSKLKREQRFLPQSKNKTFVGKCARNHNRTRYNCSVCRKKWRDSRKTLMREYYRKQYANQNYCSWAPVWKT